jgi:MFS family permease
VLNIPLPQAQVLGSRLSLVIGAGVFLLVLPAGLLADRIGRRPLLMVAGLLAAAGAVLFVLVRDLPLLFFAGGLIAVGAGIFASASWALATAIVPKNQGALYLGLANAATILGSAAGRLGGPVIDGLNQLTGERAVGYLVVFSLAAVFFVGSSLAVLKIREK